MTGSDSAQGASLVTVIVALAVNVAVAVAKTVAAVLTGSASMVAESAHSWADSGNEVLLLIAERRSAHPADAGHPVGFGREAYVWSMFAGFGLFAVGAAVSIWHGVQSLLAPEPADDYVIAYAVLVVSAVLEGISFFRSVRQARASAGARRRGVVEQVFFGSNPTLRAVFAEDGAALIGLAIAALGLLLHQVTGNAAYDAVGSILVGVLLGVVAVVLIDRNRRFLVGQVVDADIRDEVLATLLHTGSIDRVTYLHMEFVGPEQVYLVAAVDLTGDDVESHLAVRLRRIEDRIKQQPFVQEAILTPALPSDVALVPRTETPSDKLD